MHRDTDGPMLILNDGSVFPVRGIKSYKSSQIVTLVLKNSCVSSFILFAGHPLFIPSLVLCLPSWNFAHYINTLYQFGIFCNKLLCIGNIFAFKN
jgi:hypothetical protein